ncbi:LPS export ABC transporter permease LptF [Hyphomicrobium sp.]|jgi:lipopolysaccharide export system permease protein|uniref:LPS export ABC transporter permease LptF n=1 Tax=Hyphomicrobium sp. TaxID=82 RepID=UPI002CF9FA3B|nr:LPS export ABC transporter permease LptF [Hyphomicrobium sp.]HVZ05277.1 LPS export ABC transporter permease LptF [Hyphomicrobium sp.]
MRIFSKYVFRQAAGAFLLILVSLTGVVWIALALRQFNVVTSEGQDTWMLIKMTSLAVPNLMAIIAPFSYLIAALQTLNRLNTDSELIVLSASGSKVWTAARPLLFLALLVSIFLAFVSHLAQPWSMRQLREYMVQVRSDLLTQVIQPGRFTSPEDGLMFHIRDRDADGELLGLVMHDTRDKAQSQSYLAEHGTIVKQDGTAYLVMTNGHIIRRTDADGPPQIVAFDKYIVDLDRFEPQDAGAGELKPRERYLSELLHPDTKSKLYQNNPGQFRSELHERFTNPLYPIAFAFLIIAIVGQAQSTRSSRMESLILTFVVAATCRLGGLAVTNAVVRHSGMVVVAYGLPVAMIVVSFIILRRSERQRAGPGVAGKAMDIFSSLWAAARGRFAGNAAKAVS